MPGRSAYLFLELAVLIFFVAFCWERFDWRQLASARFWRVALSIAGTWFVIDEVALHAGIWDFPEGGTFPIRLAGLPLEECLLFVLHTLMCFLLLRLFRGERG